jgi:hypothetical protein
MPGGTLFMIRILFGVVLGYTLRSGIAEMHPYLTLRLHSVRLYVTYVVAKVARSICQGLILFRICMGYLGLRIPPPWLVQPHHTW